MMNKVWNKVVLNKIANWVFWSIMAVFGLGALYIIGLITVFDTFHVPGHSMTPTIHPGEHGVINKLKLGGRLFDIYAAADGRSFNVRRFPGYGRLERNDIIVFNGPFTESWDSIAMNMYTYYCKRAVAVAGDTIEIRDGHYRVKGFDKELGVSAEQDIVSNYFKDFQKTNNEEMPKWVKTLPFDDEIGWTILEFGPMIIPKEGLEITLDYQNTLLYRKYIAWETGYKVEWNGETATIDGIPAQTYTFRENYCFAAGDHAINSQDSRYWGLVPEKFIVGVIL